MTFETIMSVLESKGNEQTVNIYRNHGAQGELFGVKVADLKPIQKAIKKNYALSKQLFESKNSDAMYLAGLIADEKKMTKDDLFHWAKNATWHQISEYTVAWIAAESDYGWDVALEWIAADDEKLETAGWTTLSNLVALENKTYNVEKLSELLDFVEKNIHQSKNRVRYTMNGFVISIGLYVPKLFPKAFNCSENIGVVKVNIGNTACKVPVAKDYIQKVKDSGRSMAKKKTVRC